jgi:ABC-2 type transport system permease protein
VTNLPSLYYHRSRLEIRLLLRNRNAVVFSMLLPVFLLFIFGSVFNKTKLGNTGVSFDQYFVAGLLASGLLYSAFQQLAIAIPEERSNGTLKRLVGSPMPPSVYFVGKLAAATFTYIFQAIALLAIGHFSYGIHLPSSVSLWLDFAWISALGLAASALLGIAFSNFAKNGQSASALASPVVLFFQFTSGVFFVYANLPKWMQDVAAIFPLKWMAQAMRGVFLPKLFASQEVGHSFELPKAAVILGAWTLAAALICRFTFHWLPKNET